MVNSKGEKSRALSGVCTLVIRCFEGMEATCGEILDSERHADTGDSAAGLSLECSFEYGQSFQ